ncbi:N-acetyltransferase [Pseudomonas sp. Z13]|uniref:N-acetyltransferase n=1 Tax=Pseudomonas sp. Z13 TaxID=2983409 RepID=UPI002E7FC260|nr:N-acetyltransferase [Pseudomonas sp. Z13]
MSIFEPLHDFFLRRAVKKLNESASTTRLVRERVESKIGFVYPGANFIDSIQIADQSVGYVDYGINPLGDRLYINRIKVEPGRQQQYIGLHVLWLLWLKHGLPIVPLNQNTGYRTRRRLVAAGAQIGDELRSDEQMRLEQLRWQHLLPKRH